MLNDRPFKLQSLEKVIKLTYNYFSKKLVKKKIIGSLIYSALIIVGVECVNAEVLFDSSSNPVFDFDLVNNGVALNASFSTVDHPTNLNLVHLYWKRGANESGLINLNLLGDNKGVPGAQLEVLGEIDATSLPIGDQWIVFPIKPKKLLLAKTRYWIQVKSISTPGSMAYSREHHGYGVKSEYYLNMYGLHQNSETGPYLFKIEGDPRRD